MTNSLFYIIIVCALGLPSAAVGFFVSRLEKKLDKRAKDQEEKEDIRATHEKMILDLIMASLALAEVTAEAVQRIPDANCNGEMAEALKISKDIQNKYKDYERTQIARNVAI